MLPPTTTQLTLLPPSLGIAHLLSILPPAQKTYIPINTLTHAHSHSITINNRRITQSTLIPFQEIQPALNDQKWKEMIENVPKPCAIFDGTHSPTLRTYGGKREFTVWPYAVYYARTRHKQQTKQTIHSTHLQQVRVHRVPNTNILLQIFQNSENERAYTYSRPAYTNRRDPLFNPHRTKEQAKNIPHELFEEFQELTQDSTLPTDFKQVFDVENAKQDHIINWLMRTALVPKDVLQGLERDGIYLGGDAVHTTPLIGSQGAQEAMKDAEEIANGLDNYVERCYPRWQEFVDQSVERLRQMHN
jgi:2-polyprenyl-6-methoxyphenol hydroxylase-like FAD-dependent oxidoreductase